MMDLLTVALRATARLTVIAVLAIGIFGIPLVANAHGKSLIVDTTYGPVKGVKNGGIREYLGIPYAAPPVDDLRWRPPVPPKSWQAPRDGSEYGPNCPQIATTYGIASTNEDCLYLNVFRPNRRIKNPWGAPVMVWIHGGAMTYGLSNDWYPRKLVEKGMVVVTINYRLGVLGFLSHPALSAASVENRSGNYGIMDQQAALRWVRDNIAAFGGNPSKVTIFGYSAGGLSVFSHMTSPDSAGLFHRAIIQSGSYVLEPPTLEQYEMAGMAFANDAGCPLQDEACLRSLSVETILAAQGLPSSGFLPVVDGVTLPMTFVAAFATGMFNQVPVIIGGTHDEFSLFVASYFDLRGGPVTEASYPYAIAAILGIPFEVTPYIMAQYPLSDYTSPGAALTAIGTDAVFVCPSYLATRLLSQHVRTYSYEFNDPNAPQIYLPPVSFPYGAYHVGEVQYILDARASLPAPAFTEEQEALSDDMVSYWSMFARIANPNWFFTPLWRRFVADSDERWMSLEPTGSNMITDLPVDHKCAFWAALSGN